MSRNGIPSKVHEFIFESVDSIELLDVLLFLRSRRDREWTAEQVSNELRTNAESTANRLAELWALGILKDKGTKPPSYLYCPKNSDQEAVIDSLAEVCKVRRHKVYELIFSSLKSARKFLNAFTIPDRKEGGDD